MSRAEERRPHPSHSASREAGALIIPSSSSDAVGPCGGGGGRVALSAGQTGSERLTEPERRAAGAKTSSSIRGTWNGLFVLRSEVMSVVSSPPSFIDGGEETRSSLNK
ncbi:hypothetical protein EYF80_066341 [Liparis tanakae]|uniref:Uncharacterized protein n=1 Tax=Liparis tanakae TaxID=230148 RepID=A0A4Z2E490_9TELE|nr:hypothetical protein EYF80_066341 [Liparis tanakae]